MTEIILRQDESGLFEETGDESDDSQTPGNAANGSNPQDPANITPPAGLYYLSPPPELTYGGPDEAIQAMHDWNKIHGFDVSRQKPMKNKDGELYKYLYRCTKHGRLDNNRKLTDETRKRKRKSGKIGCPMGIYVKAEEPSNPQGRWRVVHQQNGRSNFHNHEAVPGIELTGHRRRQRTEELKTLIRQQRALGMDANQTLAFLKERDPDALVTRQDILNYRRADPGPVSDHNVYTDKPYILCLAFLQDFETDALYGKSLLRKLRMKMPVSVCGKLDMFVRHFQRNPPRAVLVSDQALTYPDYRVALARLVTYNQDGGTVIFMGHFAHNGNDMINNMFLHHYNLEWEAAGEFQDQTAVKLNDQFASGTNGRYTVVAKNFSAGTDVAAIQALLQLCPEAALVNCRLYSQNPIVTAELVFSTQAGAESVINTFHGKSVNLGRVSTAEGRELQFALRNPSPVNVSSLNATTFVKANFLQKVNPDSIVYQYIYPPNAYTAWNPAMIPPPAQPALACATYTKVGKGWMGFVGQTNYDDNYANTVAAMCHF
jgi:FAR1 DNA-binding domain